MSIDTGTPVLQNRHEYWKARHALSSGRDIQQKTQEEDVADQENIIETDDRLDSSTHALSSGRDAEIPQLDAARREIIDETDDSSTHAVSSRSDKKIQQEDAAGNINETDHSITHLDFSTVNLREKEKAVSDCIRYCSECHGEDLSNLYDDDGYLLGKSCKSMRCQQFMPTMDDTVSLDEVKEALRLIQAKICTNCDNTNIYRYTIIKLTEGDGYHIRCEKCGTNIPLNHADSMPSMGSSLEQDQPTADVREAILSDQAKCQVKTEDHQQKTSALNEPQETKTAEKPGWHEWSKGLVRRLIPRRGETQDSSERAAAAKKSINKASGMLASCVPDDWLQMVGLDPKMVPRSSLKKMIAIAGVQIYEAVEEVQILGGERQETDPDGVETSVSQNHCERSTEEQTDANTQEGVEDREKKGYKSENELEKLDGDNSEEQTDSETSSYFTDEGGEEAQMRAADSKTEENETELMKKLRSETETMGISNVDSDMGNCKSDMHADHEKDKKGDIISTVLPMGFKKQRQPKTANPKSRAGRVAAMGFAMGMAYLPYIFQYAAGSAVGAAVAPVAPYLILPASSLGALVGQNLGEAMAGYLADEK